MPWKDYYSILGISSGESQQGIKSAFRVLAQRHHPDRAGVQSTRKFQDIAEAYQTLGDQKRRAKYDDDRRRAVADVPLQTHPASGLAPVEPFDVMSEPIHRRDTVRAPGRPLSVLDDFLGGWPVRDTIRDAFQRSFTDAWASKSGRADALNLAVELTREEALHGADLALAVPTSFPCSYCHGAGHVWLASCPRCHGAGRIASEGIVRASLPPMVTDGTIFELSLRELGIQNVRLRLMIRIGDHGS